MVKQKTQKEVNISEQISLFESIKSHSLHDHLCLIYENQIDQFDAVLPFIRIGLAKGEKCIYIADDNTADQVICAMRAYGIDVESTSSKSALVIATRKQIYLKQDYFDPDEMIQFLKETTDSAKKKGFPAIRVIGEMTWMLGKDPGYKRLMEYESKLNLFLPGNDCISICMYNKNRFSPEIITNVINTHPLVIAGGFVCKNFYYIPPEEFLKKEKKSLEVERLLHNLIGREKAAFAEAKARQELNQMKYILMSITCHELRTPLNYITGFSTLLLNDLSGKLNPEQKELIGIINSSGNRILSIMSDVIDLSKIDSGEVKRQVCEFNLRHVVDKAVSKLRVHLMEKGLTISTEIEDIPMRTDKKRLFQCITNLLLNAINFSEKGTIKITSRIIENRVHISVMVTGIGISPEEAQEPFSPFMKLESPLRLKTSGIGSRLFFTKKLATNVLGGDVDVQSEMGIGSTFTLQVPVDIGTKT